MDDRRPIRTRARGQQGYTIVTVLFLLAVMGLALAAAAPRLARQLQRDREVETIHRGKQYARAVKMYYKKNGGYPPNVDALTKSTGLGNIRYLRKKYLDPMTGKDDWKPVQVGQNKAPTAMGFFGKPLAGTSTGTSSLATGSIAGASPLTSSLSSSTTSTSSASGGTTSSTSSTFGGLGVMGFSPGLSKKSILVYKTKQRYNEWEFVYDPVADQKLISSSSLGSNTVSTNSSAITTSTTSSTSTTSASSTGSTTTQ